MPPIPPVQPGMRTRWARRRTTRSICGLWTWRSGRTWGRCRARRDSRGSRVRLALLGRGYSGGGFVEMVTSIPAASRISNTLYGLILGTFT